MKKLLIVLLSVISVSGIAQTRLYFSSTETAPVNPIYDASWYSTSQAGRYKLNNAKGSSAISVGSAINIAGYYSLDRQYVSSPMNAGIIFNSSVTITGQLMVREYANNDEVKWVMTVIKIVSEDGNIVRIQFNLDSSPTASEFINNASHRNKSMKNIYSSSYTTVQGDRIVIEIGYSHQLGTTPQASAKWGENAPDLPQNETQTSDGAGWIQFSNNITFTSEPESPPQTAFACGFECGVAGPHLTLGGAASFNTNNAFVRSGNRSVHINPNSGYGAIEPNFVGNGSTCVIRAYIYFPVLPTADCNLISIGASFYVITTMLGASFSAVDNQIHAGIGGAAGNGVSVTAGQWYKIDVKVSTLDDIWTVDVKVNNVSTSQATGNFAGGQYLGGIEIGASILGATTTCDFYVDDLAITTALNDYPIADGNIYPFVPVSDGPHNIMGANNFRRTLTTTDILNTTIDAYQLIDELPVGAGSDWINMLGPPNTTDYVQCKFGPPSGITQPVTAPNAVSVVCALHQASTGEGNMEIRLNDNGITNTIYSSSQIPGTTSLKYVQKYYSSSPSGGPWTIASGSGNFNNLKIQFGSPTALDVNPNQYFDGAIIEANFPSSASPPPRRVRLIQ
jgi:hypothetical protein